MKIQARAYISLERAVATNKFQKNQWNGIKQLWSHLDSIAKLANSDIIWIALKEIFVYVRSRCIFVVCFAGMQ